MNTPITQDWNPVVIRKKKTSKQIREENASKKKSIVKTHQNKQKNAPDVNALKLEKEEIGKHEKVSVSLSKQIQKARLAKKLSQEQLAKLVNEKKSVIAEYENGKAIPDGKIMNKLSKALGVTLRKNPKKPKKK